MPILIWYLLLIRGYWHQWAAERFGDLPPKVDPGAFSGQTGMEDPQEDPLAVHCFCVCSGSALLGDLLGVSRERDLLSVLSIYSLCIVVFNSAICWWVLIALVLLSVLAPPLPFGRICFMLLVMRKGGESSSSGPWQAGIYAVHWKFSMCTATRTSSYSLVGPSVFFLHI